MSSLVNFHLISYSKTRRKSFIVWVIPLLKCKVSQQFSCLWLNIFCFFFFFNKEASIFLVFHNSSPFSEVSIGLLLSKRLQQLHVNIVYCKAKQNFVQILCPYLIVYFLTVEFFVYFGYKSLSEMFCKYFLSLWHVFHSFSSIFCRAEVFSLMKSHLPVFFLMGHAFGVVFKNSLPNPKTPRFSSVLSSRSFVFYIQICNLF